MHSISIPMSDWMSEWMTPTVTGESVTLPLSLCLSVSVSECHCQCQSVSHSVSVTLCLSVVRLSQSVSRCLTLSVCQTQCHWGSLSVSLSVTVTHLTESENDWVIESVSLGVAFPFLNLLVLLSDSVSVMYYAIYNPITDYFISS